MLPKPSDTASSDIPLSAKALSGTALCERTLSDGALDCYQHADHCARQAELQRDPKLREDFRYLEQGWLKLARSLEFAERTEFPRRSSE